MTLTQPPTLIAKILCEENSVYFGHGHAGRQIDRCKAICRAQAADKPLAQTVLLRRLSSSLMACSSGQMLHKGFVDTDDTINVVENSVRLQRK